MIFEAIGALKEREGSSKRAIAKYIEGAYKNLPPTHDVLLVHHLKRLKSNGELVMNKKSYMLPRSENHFPDLSPPDAAATSTITTADPAASASASVGPKRGRGRPPKPKPSITPTAAPTLAAEPISQVFAPGFGGQSEVDVNNVPLQPPVQQPQAPLAAVVKKSPGRPRKIVPNGLPVQVGVKRGRGRPPKSASGQKKRPGRPKLSTETETAVSTMVLSLSNGNGVKRSRGRPPRAQTTSIGPQAHPIAVPYANDATSIVTTVPSVPKPRGRPPKAAGAVPTFVGGGTVSGKRRGRPPKVGGVVRPMFPRKSTGRPVGRPKKTTEGPAQQAALAVAYGDLQRKLELFQAKVKLAVGIIKPQLTGASNMGVVAAIQELEGLVATDVSVPFREEA